MEKVIAELIEKDELRMTLLRAHHELSLPDSCIAAGFVRNLVWDYFHAYQEITPLNDVDVVYTQSVLDLGIIGTPLLLRSICPSASLLRLTYE